MSGRARSTSTLTTLASTFCPTTTSTTNTSIMRTEGRRSCDRATTAATTITTTVLPSCVIARNTDVEKSVAFVAPHVARPRSTTRGAGVRTHHPEQDADRDRADDDGGQRNGEEESGRHLRIDPCAHERAHRPRGPRPRGAPRRWSARGEAGSAAGQRRTAAETAAPAATATTTRTSTITIRGLPNVQSVKPKCMQTPSTAAGAVGVASQPTRARRSSQSDARSRQPDARSSASPCRATGSIPNRADRPNIWPRDSTATDRLSSRR